MQNEPRYTISQKVRNSASWKLWKAVFTSMPVLRRQRISCINLRDSLHRRALWFYQENASYTLPYQQLARTFPAKPAAPAVFTPMPVPPMSAAVSPQPKRLPTPEELFGVIPQRPVSTPASSVMYRPMMPLPVRRPGGKIYERDLREILELLDEPVEDLTKNFANMNMGPKRMKTGNVPWGLGTEPRRYMGLEKRPWGV